MATHSSNLPGESQGQGSLVGGVVKSWTRLSNTHTHKALHWASQVARVAKNLPAKAGDMRDRGPIPGSGRSPGGGHGNPLQYSCPESPHGQRSLAGYSPWGHKDSDITKHSIAQHFLSCQNIGIDGLSFS